MQLPKRSDLVYPELSYRIVGILFEVHNQIGSGHHEKVYQRALSVGFQKHGLVFKEQVYTPLMFENKNVGSYFLDFLVDGKVVLEIKKGDRFSRSNIEQVMTYLKTYNLKLGILANFGHHELNYKRIVNFDS